MKNEFNIGDRVILYKYEEINGPNGIYLKSQGWKIGDHAIVVHSEFVGETNWITVERITGSGERNSYDPSCFVLLSEYIPKENKIPEEFINILEMV